MVHYSLFQSLLNRGVSLDPPDPPLKSFEWTTKEINSNEPNKAIVGGSAEIPLNVFDILSGANDTELLPLVQAILGQDKQELKTIQYECEKEMENEKKIEMEKETKKANTIKRFLQNSLVQCILHDVHYLPRPMYLIGNQIQAITRFNLFIALPLSLASHENNLLQESGFWKFNSYSFEMKACENGSKCKAITSNIKDLPKTIKPLMIYMSQDEWNALPMLPLNTQRPCLLCYRYYTCRFVFNIRLKQPQVQVSNDFNFQLFRNLINSPTISNGYNTKHMLFPPNISETWLGFAHPLVLFQPSLLSGFYNPQLGRWMISQDPIRGHAGPL